MEQPFFSIIIPHHNTPSLLRRLLDSIPWKLVPEVIVVDDASEATNLDALEEMKALYPIQVYSICRHTAGAARNEGLRHAHGKWLLFADADDFFLLETELLLREHQEDVADVVFFGVSSVYSDSGKPAYRDRQVMRLIERCTREESLNALRALHTNPWGKMIRRSLVEEKQIGFEEIASANDAMFSVRCGIAALDVALDKRLIYCITVSDESMTANVSQVRFESNGQARLRVNALLRENGYAAYQLPILGYLLGSWKYGLRYGCKVYRDCLHSGSNIWTSMGRLLNPSNLFHSLKSMPK